MTMEPVGIEFEAVRKTFDRRVRALDGFSLAVPRGRFCGLLGRNGAGKTTALRVALGLLGPDEGEARVLGERFAGASAAARSRVAYVPQEVRLTARLTVAELVRYLSGLYPAYDRGGARALAQRLDVPWDRRVGTLSVGSQRKAAALLALASRAEVLVLDEPAAGLDPIARRELTDALVELLSETPEVTVLLSTHLVGDLERLADTVAFVDAGRVVREGEVEALTRRFRRVQVVLDGAPPPGLRIPGELHRSGSGSVINAVAELESDGALDELRARPGTRVEVFPMTLEEVFVELIGPAPDDPDRVLVVAEEGTA